MLLPVGPQILYRVQFRRIGGKELQPQAPALLADKLPHCAAAVRRQAIPNDQQFAGNVPQQMGEELNDLGPADRAGKQAEVKVPPGDARDGRQRLPVEMVLQHRSLSSRRPGAAAVGPLAQSALVDENDRPSFFLGFFLISGQRFRFHSWIFSSLRSRARPVGR